MKKTETTLPEFEVTVFNKLRYEMKKVINAKNEYEAVLQMADFLSGDFDYCFDNDDYEIISVVRTD